MFKKLNNIENIYEDFKPYLQESRSIEDNSLLHYDLSAEGWRYLLTKYIDDIIYHKLGLKRIGNYIWASEYKNGKRKVLSFFFINNAYATLQWGWNFNFVPTFKSNKITYARTDKSIFTHIYEVPKEFIDGNHKERDKVIISRYNIEIDNVKRGILKIINKHLDVINYLISRIIEYFDKTDEYSRLLKKIEHQYFIDDYCRYYRVINANIYYMIPFIKIYIGQINEALLDSKKLNFKNDEQKDYYLRHLYKLIQRKNIE